MTTLKIPPHLKCVAALPCEMTGTFVPNSDRWPGFMCHVYAILFNGHFEDMIPE